MFGFLFYLNVVEEHLRLSAWVTNLSPEASYRYPSIPRISFLFRRLMIVIFYTWPRTKFQRVHIGSG